MHPVIVNVSIASSEPFPALLFNDRVMALAHWRSEGLRGTSSIGELLDDWALNAERLQQICRTTAPQAIMERGAERSAFRLHAPVPRRQVYCTIGNYRSQVLQAALDADSGGNELARREAVSASIEKRRKEGAPYVCLKGPASIAGPFDPLRIEAAAHATLDWEVEIGVVIGRRARNVEAVHAFDYVAGYCVVNDITLRDRVFRHDLPMLRTDWLQSKSLSGWLPCGPWLVPAWAVDDSSALRPWLRLNGELMQDGVADDMIFGIADQIAYLSRHTALNPGDLVCTGTPAGIGSHYGRYLHAGDVIEAGVSELGVQRVVCVDWRT